MGCGAYVLHGPEVSGEGGFLGVLPEAYRRGARVYPEGNGSSGPLVELLEQRSVGYSEVAHLISYLS